MAKKIFIIIACFIMVGGIIVSVVGCSMGGGPGGISVDGTEVYWRSADGSERHSMGRISAAYGRLIDRFANWNGRHYDSLEYSDGYDYDYGYEYAEGAEYAEDAEHAEHAYPGNSANGQYTPVPFAQGELKKLTIDIDAGYVEVYTGDQDAMGLWVSGPIPYTTSYADGEWRIESNYEDVHTNGGRFWKNGVDETTYFTIILPRSFAELDLSLAAGEVDIEGLALDKAKLTTNMGRLELEDITATDLTLEVNAGELEANTVTTDTCKLKADMGYAYFSGSIARRLDAECAMGGMEIDLDEPDRYGYEVNVGAGEVAVDGQRYGGAGMNFSQNTDATPFYKLDCGMGHITLNFY